MRGGGLDVSMLSAVEATWAPHARGAVQNAESIRDHPRASACAGAGARIDLCGGKDLD